MYSNTTKTADTKFSVELSEVLNYIGYNRIIRTYRLEAYRKIHELYNQKGFPFEDIPTGSKAEGIASYFESDIDRLKAIKYVICVENDINDTHKYGNDTVFQIRHTDSGYARLKLVHLGTSGAAEEIRKHFLENNAEGETFVLNTLSYAGNEPMIDITGQNLQKGIKYGPAETYKSCFIHYDFVYAFKCHCHELMQDWINQKQHTNWPSRTIKEEILNSECYCLPVANKNRRSTDTTEWKISFCRAETILVHSFNDKETQLYILLKLINKSALQPICEAMSSYVMKNVVFWTVERFYKQHREMETLYCMLNEALSYLKECLKKCTLDCYMIPSRNLLDNRFTKEQTDRVIEQIGSLENNKDRIIAFCPKLKHAFELYRNNRSLLKKMGEIRDKIEKLVLGQNIMFKETEQLSKPSEDITERLKHKQEYINNENELYRLVKEARPETVVNKGTKECWSVVKELLS